MLFWQQVLIAIFGISSVVFFIQSLIETRKKKNVYGVTTYLFFLGAFVWGDMIVLGPFWIIVALISLILNNWYLFLLFLSVFWTIRSLGEMIYWLSEQFAGTKRNPAHIVKLYRFIKSDAIWFMNQLYWQCVFVFSLILSIFFCKMWLESL